MPGQTRRKAGIPEGAWSRTGRDSTEGPTAQLATRLGDSDRSDVNTRLKAPEKLNKTLGSLISWVT